MVKKISILLVLVFISCDNKLLTENVDKLIIPTPQKIEVYNDVFKINSSTAILADSLFFDEAHYLKEEIEKSSNFKVDIIQPIKENYKNTIQLIRENDSINKHQEYYALKIDKNSIKITAQTKQGLMRGIQTLRQVLPTEFHQKIKKNAWYVQQLAILDFPKFTHRGMLFDSCRHFFSVETIKKYIDLLALYKMNVFHWHLTEDQGWRIQIDKYPKLTEIAAFRKEKDGSIYGGFYSKEDIKEVVSYAAKRHITIIPEIELPGHSQAAIAAYSELSCTGETIEVANDWGVFKDIYCAGNENSFDFLENVLLEVIELFPSEYIHIGGDEAPKYRWEHCEKCQQRIKEENLKDEHELQSYFIKRIENFLAENNRKLIGWDEILEGGLTPTATVQSWRGFEGGIEAAMKNQYAIMSPTSHCYFDYPIETTDLAKVYSFDPIPENLPLEKEKYILGGEGNLWSEYIPNEKSLDSKTFPRLIGLSEVLWRYPENRDFNEFFIRLQKQYPLLQAYNVRYGQELVPFKIITETVEKKFTVKVPVINDIFSIKYRFNKDSLLQPFPTMLEFINTSELEIQAYKNGITYGNKFVQKFESHSALGAKVKYLTNYNNHYASSKEVAFVDGKLASSDYKNYNWQGFFGNNIECIIELDSTQFVSEVKSHFLHRQKSWIFSPQYVEVSFSNDGENWHNLTVQNSKINPKNEENVIETFDIKFSNTKAKYVKLLAKNLDRLPEWHDAPGQKVWLFLDEIIIN